MSTTDVEELPEYIDEENVVHKVRSTTVIVSTYDVDWVDGGIDEAVASEQAEYDDPDRSIARVIDDLDQADAIVTTVTAAPSVGGFSNPSAAETTAVSKIAHVLTDRLGIDEGRRLTHKIIAELRRNGLHIVDNS